MLPVKRRQFLQFAGSALATLGLSQLEIQQQSDSYARVLAQDTPRKLALLVGINTYPATSQYTALKGCTTDIDLQQQLLIHRFGFNPKDIIILTDEKATRKGILETFEEHLIKQAKLGDVVVFHYSGHGSQMADPDRDHPDGLNSTFVPVDSLLPEGFPDKGGTVQDITGHTLFLLMKALKTENVTVVLDSCHSGGGTRGNLRVRSRDGGSQLQASPQEREYQEQWRSRLKLSPSKFIQQRRAGVAKGVVIAAAKRDQLAADTSFSGFDAGAFTYLMTQYLWQQTGSEPVSSAIPNISRSTTQISSKSQVPELEVKPANGNERQPIYFIHQQFPPAEAVLTKIEGNQVEFWLGGLDSQSLEAFSKDAVFMLVDAKGREYGQVQLKERNGLVGQGQLLSAIQPRSLQPGALLQEQVRGVPSDLTLRIGLDPSLGNDATQAKEALQAIERIEALPLQQGEVHYIFGTMTAAYHRKSQTNQIANPPAIGSLGLFSTGLDLIPGSFGTPGETVTAAVSRLQAKLRSLLAARIVKMTVNTNSSRLKVAASMSQMERENRLTASSFTARGGNRPTQAMPNTISKLQLETSVQFRITNNEPRELYVSVLVIDPTGEITIIFPNNWTTSDDFTRVGAGQTL